jgi:hypothetical protein
LGWNTCVEVSAFILFISPHPMPRSRTYAHTHTHTQVFGLHRNGLNTRLRYKTADLCQMHAGQSCGDEVFVQIFDFILEQERTRRSQEEADIAAFDSRMNGRDAHTHTHTRKNRRGSHTQHARDKEPNVTLAEAVDACLMHTDAKYTIQAR